MYRNSRRGEHLRQAVNRYKFGLDDVPVDVIAATRLGIFGGNHFGLSTID